MEAPYRERVHEEDKAKAQEKGVPMKLWKIRLAKRLRDWATRLDNGAGRVYFGFAVKDIKAGTLVGEGDFVTASEGTVKGQHYFGDPRLKGRR